MAKKDDQDSQFNPKHRIVGVIIIVSLAVIFVPMILKNDPDGLRKDKQRLSHIVDKDTKVYIAKVKPPTAAAVDQTKKDIKKTSVVSTTKKDDKTKDTAKSSSKDNKKPVRQEVVASSKDNSKTKTSTTTQKPDKQKSTTTAKKGWLIQVGTFANKSNARRVSRLLKQAGFRVNMTNIEVDREKSSQSAVRIRVGPFAQKEIAKKKLAVVNRTVGVEGIVIAQH